MLSISNLNQYQEEAKKTARYPNVGTNLVYPVLGLNGEIGELYEIWQEQGLAKSVKGENLYEYGDVLWYFAAICSELNIDLADLCGYRALFITSFDGLSKACVCETATWQEVQRMCMELAGKSMIICNIVKKVSRDDHGSLTEEKRKKIIEYLADAFVAWANILCQFEVDLSQVATDNIKKLNK